MRHKIDIGWNVSEYDAKQILQLLSLTKKAKDIFLALLTLLRAFVWVRASWLQRAWVRLRKKVVDAWVSTQSQCCVLSAHLLLSGHWSPVSVTVHFVLSYMDWKVIAAKLFNNRAENISDFTHFAPCQVSKLPYSLWFLP